MADVGATTTAPHVRASISRSPASPIIVKRSDLALAIGIMAILVVLILPLPTWLLDISLAFSLSLLDPDPDDGGVHPQAAGVQLVSRRSC